MTDRTHKRPLFPSLVVDPESTAFSDPHFRGVLPHLAKPGGTYFVTFCLADVARGRALERLQTLEGTNYEELAHQSDLNPTSGSCILSKPELAAIVEDSILHFQGERCALSAWCVMPNHVHTVVTPFGNHELSRVLHSWKSYSAHVINRRLNRSGKLWQKESFDHLVRNVDSFQRLVAYTEHNPVAAGFVKRAEDWRFSSARYRDPL